MASRPKTKQAKSLIVRTIGTEEDLLNLVATGWSHRKIAALVTEKTGTNVSCYYVTKTLQSLPGYPEAKKAQAEFHASKVAEAAEQVAEGKLDPNSARIASDNHKWLAARLSPSDWGDKVSVDATITDTTQLHLEMLRNRLRTVSTQ